MAIREITIDGVGPAFEVDTEEEFAAVLDTGAPVAAPREVIDAFGIPDPSVSPFRTAEEDIWESENAAGAGERET